MRHVTLDCHLIAFARPSSFFFLCPVTRNGVGSGCPIYFWALIKAEKALQKPSGRGGWKLSDGVCSKFQQYCFSIASPLGSLLLMRYDWNSPRSPPGLSCLSSQWLPLYFPRNTRGTGPAGPSPPPMPVTTPTSLAFFLHLTHCHMWVILKLPI